MPVQIEDRYVSPAAAPEYLAQDFTTQTPYVYLMAAAPISEAEHVIDAVHATPAERKLLKIEAQRAVPVPDPHDLVERPARQLFAPALSRRPLSPARQVQGAL